MLSLLERWVLTLIEISTWLTFSNKSLLILILLWFSITNHLRTQITNRMDRHAGVHERSLFNCSFLKVDRAWWLWFWWSIWFIILLFFYFGLYWFTVSICTKSGWVYYNWCFFNTFCFGQLLIGFIETSLTTFITILLIEVLSPLFLNNLRVSNRHINFFSGISRARAWVRARTRTRATTSFTAFRGIWRRVTLV